MAIAVNDDSGAPTYARCGALEVDFPGHFLGFVSITVASGNPVLVTTGRGSKVTPLVEGAIPLVPEQTVYLALTPGYVTQTIPVADLVRIVRVGYAVDTTDMILNTDFEIAVPRG
jgi:hypothetical protein